MALGRALQGACAARRCIHHHQMYWRCTPVAGRVLATMWGAGAQSQWSCGSIGIACLKSPLRPHADRNMRTDLAHRAYTLRPAVACQRRASSRADPLCLCCCEVSGMHALWFVSYDAPRTSLTSDDRPHQWHLNGVLQQTVARCEPEALHCSCAVATDHDSICRGSWRTANSARARRFPRLGPRVHPAAPAAPEPKVPARAPEANQ